MAEIRIKDVPSVQNIKDSDKFPVSVGDDNAHTCTAKVLKTYIGAGGGGGGLTEVSWVDIKDKPTFSEVATSGRYGDLTETPTIPSKTSDLTNDNNFITISQVSSGFIPKPKKITEKGGITEINVSDNSIIDFDAPIERLTIKGIRTCEIGSNIYFTSAESCQLIIPDKLIKIGDFDKIIPNQRYAISVKDNSIAIAKEGYFSVGGKEVVELSGALIELNLEPNKIYLIDCFKNDINTEKITILNNLATFDESQIFVKNVLKPVQFVLPTDVIKFGNVPSTIEAGQVIRIDVQLNTYLGYIGG